MLEITNLRDGAILNRHHGIETENYLEIKIEGLANPQAEVTVKGLLSSGTTGSFLPPSV